MHFIARTMAVALCLAVVHATEADFTGAGSLVIAGGAIKTAESDLWGVLLAGRKEGRPIGIISTASEDPASVGEAFSKRINETYGAGSTVFLPLGVKSQPVDEPALLERIQRCGGFYFTGGSQERTMQTLLRSDGTRTRALDVIWELYLSGGVIGGSSAGAAVMSHPMISGGTSADAIRRGVPNGVSIEPGLGFHPGILYCQHHLERARYGRLMAALLSGAAAGGLGIGVCEDTALVVEPQTGRGRVIGANGVLVLDVSAVSAVSAGGWAGMRVHYLTVGDHFDFKTRNVTPASEKDLLQEQLSAANQTRSFLAWEKNALQKALRDMASDAAVKELVADDGAYRIHFERTSETRVYANADASSPAVTNLEVRLEVNDAQLSLELPAGKHQGSMTFEGKVIRVFSYRPPRFEKGPLFVVMHGVDRNAEDYRDRAISMAERFGALVVAPEFDLKQFPPEAYQRGGVTRDGKQQPKEKWTFTAVHRLVKLVRETEVRPDMPWYAIGHSAGGQILTRLAALMPGDATGIVAANPGTLIFPNRKATFPLGFGGLPPELGDDAALQRYLATPLTLYLGDQDLGSKNLDLSTAAKAQGMTRFERGHNCFKQAEALARERGWSFAWRLVEADGIGHDSTGMFAHPNVKKALFE